MPQFLIKPLRIGAGVLLIIVGIAGLFLPIIQGVACIIAGAYLVHPEWSKPLHRFFVHQITKIKTRMRGLKK